LRIPLFATSVATWLEPGYLGDALKRMTTAFREAEAASPSILFIDEIDGLGTRSSGKDWSDYHNAVVNRSLELLDGAAKIRGIVVIGATNRPEAIDRAVLRSGRLETHVVIPQPNTETLIGILEHHLGTDLDAIIASAPPEAIGDIKDSDGSPTSSPDETVLDPVDADFEKAVAAKPVPDHKDSDTHSGPRATRSKATPSEPTEDFHDDTV
jgi:SpoVK/Ycf46/Vps4 family AAA+-type ATPase